MQVALVLGYGIFTEDNEKYRNYLDRVRQLDQDNKFDRIIFCGGKTNPKYPDFSEAQSMISYLGNYRTEGMLIEERSITTPENIRYAKEQIASSKDDLEGISVICDSYRVPKVTIMSLMQLGGLVGQNWIEEDVYRRYFKTIVDEDLDLCGPVKINFEKITIYGIAYDLSTSNACHQINSAMLETNFDRFPNLEADFIAYRKKKWGLK